MARTYDICNPKKGSVIKLYDNGLKFYNRNILIASIDRYFTTTIYSENMKLSNNYEDGETYYTIIKHDYDFECRDIKLSFDRAQSVVSHYNGDSHSRQDTNHYIQYFDELITISLAIECKYHYATNTIYDDVGPAERLNYKNKKHLISSVKYIDQNVILISGAELLLTDELVEKIKSDLSPELINFIVQCFIANIHKYFTPENGVLTFLWLNTIITRCVKRRNKVTRWVCLVSGFAITTIATWYSI